MSTENHKKQLKKHRILRTSRWILSTVGLLVIIAGLWQSVLLFLDYKKSETTNDAQIEQYVSPINIKVPGYIRKIYFTEHQYVRKGDTLLVLDDSEYRIRLKEAEAALMDAQAGKNVLETTLNTTQNNAAVFIASIKEAETKVSKLKKDYERYQNLVERKAATPVQLEQIKTELDMTKARIEALKTQQKAAQSSVNEVSKRQENSKAAIQRAEANVEMMRLNLSYTIVTAPCDGVLGRRNMEEGQLVNGGQNITNIIPDTKKWVIANYKETQIGNLTTGQKVNIKVDAFPDKIFTGEITAISGATGSKYALVPADNSTGNFVKIQQRIPVRIEFTNLSSEENRLLAAGMMAEVEAILKK